MSESHEARQLEIFGSKLFFETNAVAPIFRVKLHT